MTDPHARLSAALADRYQLVRELGAGGMATVWLAQDLRHGRDVAIKVLHLELGVALGGDRFLAEIRTTARLQHPHILPLLDSGDAGDGLLYYVMPLVTGETLRARLERERQLPIAEALRLAREVAAALDYAHRQGIVHRDIKPENILLHDGSALVADFGIALAVQQAGGQRLTQTGLSLGTPQYMAPEQALGEKVIDARADIYALGAVTYEMLVGDPPFTGSSVQAIVARMLSERPTSLATLRDTVPASVEQTVMTALARLPADRFSTAAEFAAALSTPHSGEAGALQRGGRSQPASRWIPLATVAAIALVAGAFGTWSLTRNPPAPRDLGFPPRSPMYMADWYRNFAVAPDGSFIVYESRAGVTTQLFLRSMDSPDVRPIAGTEGAFGTPRISPDGRRVAFVANNELKVVTLENGSVNAIARETNPTGGGWTDDGKTLYLGSIDGRRARWIDVGSGAAREMTVAPCMLPRLIGNGKRLLCGGGGEKFATERRIDAPMIRITWRRAGGSGTTAAVIRGADFRIVDDDYLVYVALDGTLMGARIVNRDSLLVGPSIPLIPSVRRSPFTGAGQYDLTRDGTLVYAPGINPDIARLVRASPDGRLTPLTVDEAVHLRFTPSPDGSHVASIVEGVEQQELRVYDLGTGKFDVLARGFFIGPVVWSPDGQRMAYKKMDDPDHEELMEHGLDGSTPRTLYTMSPPALLQTSSWVADDQLLIGAGGGTDQSSALLIDPTRTPPRVDTLGINSLFISISPDRRWLVYQPQGSGNVILQPWPARDRRWIIDTDGIEPRFASSTEVRFMRPIGNDSTRTVRIFRTTINAGQANPVGRTELLVSDARFADTPGWSHVGMPGGDELYAQSSTDNVGHYLRVIPRWTDEMKRRVDAATR